MGKKSTPKVPDAYKLEDLMKYQTDLNRFDSVNPWGSQTWSTGDDGRWKMTQAIDPKFQGLMDKQLAFVNQGPNKMSMPGPMQDSYQALMDKRAAVNGATRGYHPDVPQYADTGQGAPAESMMPGHSVAPEDPTMAEKMASALDRYGSIKGREWAAFGGAAGDKLRNNWKAKH